LTAATAAGKFAAERHVSRIDRPIAAGAVLQAPALSSMTLSIDISCSHGAEQQTRGTPLLRSNDGTDRQADTNSA